MQLTFTPADWYEPQSVTITVTETLTDFGELQIRHSVTSSDPNYDNFPVGARTLKLTDVDASLEVLTLKLAAGAAPVTLRRGNTEDVEDGGFDSNVLEYVAEVPFDSDRVFITATPAVPEDLEVDGTLVQNRAEVRLFRRLDSGDEPLANGADIAARPDLPVGLPTAEDEFVLLAEVSVPPLEMDGVTTYQIYTLTLRRALPAEAELVIFLAADEERRTPLTAATPLLFGPDEDAKELVLVVRDRDGTSYAIVDGEVSFELSPAEEGAVRLVVEVGEQTETDGDFATPVTLGRDAARTVGTFTFALTFTATPERPLAADAEDLTAEIAGTLSDNAATRTQIRATYRGHDQESARGLDLGQDQGLRQWEPDYCLESGSFGRRRSPLRAIELYPRRYDRFAASGQVDAKGQPP